MSKNEVKWQGFSAEQLLEFEWSYCNPSLRTIIPKECETHPRVHCGYVMGHFASRLKTGALLKSPHRKCNKKVLASYLHVEPTTFTHSLKDRAKNTDWNFFKKLLHFILLGDNNTNPSTKSKEIAERIVSFFFDNSDLQYFTNEPPSFFSVEYLRNGAPCRKVEALYVILSLSTAKPEEGNRKLYLVSGGLPFAQYEKFELTDLGKASIVAAIEGVEIYMIYPQIEHKTSAEKSATEFRKTTKKYLKDNSSPKYSRDATLESNKKMNTQQIYEVLDRIKLCPIDPFVKKKVGTQIWWGGLFLCPIYRYVFLETSPNMFDSGSSFFISRDSESDERITVPYTYRGTNKESETFKKWIELFVTT